MGTGSHCAWGMGDMPKGPCIGYAGMHLGGRARAVNWVRGWASNAQRARATPTDSPCQVATSVKDTANRPPLVLHLSSTHLAHPYGASAEEEGKRRKAYLLLLPPPPKHPLPHTQRAEGERHGRATKPLPTPPTEAQGKARACGPPRVGVVGGWGRIRQRMCARISSSESSGKAES